MAKYGNVYSLFIVDSGCVRSKFEGLAFENSKCTLVLKIEPLLYHESSDSSFSLKGKGSVCSSSVHVDFEAFLYQFG